MVEQTYDNAVKVINDRSKTSMALIAGEANIGQEPAMDFIITRDLEPIGSTGDQEKEISALIDMMVQQKQDYWAKTTVEPERWPGPTILLAVPAFQRNFPRIWRIDLRGAKAETAEILTRPGIYLEGSYNEVFGLLYGYHPEVLNGITDQLGLEKEKISEAITNLKVLKPVDKLSLWSIPIQDAIDLAVFLAKVQVEMDRFLPGQPACGGPIDVMVLQTVPERAYIVLSRKAAPSSD